MGTLIVTLHVLAAIFLIGPLTVAPFMGLRAIVRRDPDAVRRASRTTMLLALGSGLVFLLGLAATALSDEATYSTPWITISITLSAIAVLGLLLVAVPALRSVAGLLDEGGGAADRQARARLDSLRGRIGVSAGLAALAWTIVVVLMMTKPFA